MESLPLTCLFRIVAFLQISPVVALPEMSFGASGCTLKRDSVGCQVKPRRLEGRKQPLWMFDCKGIMLCLSPKLSNSLFSDG